MNKKAPKTKFAFKKVKKYFNGNQKVKSAYSDQTVKSATDYMSESDTINKAKTSREDLNQNRTGASNTVSSIASAFGPIGTVVGAGVGISQGLQQKDINGLDKGLYDESGNRKKQISGESAMNSITTDTGTAVIDSFKSGDTGRGVANLFLGAGGDLLWKGLGGKTNAEKEFETQKKEEAYITNQSKALQGFKDYGTQADAIAKDGKKQLKYKKINQPSKQSREIETEGREPIFSPKKTDGTRDLLYYNPNDPTHSEGGVKAKVVPKKYQNGINKIYADSLMTANKDKNFVKRYLEPSKYPVIKNKDGSISTHKMLSYDGKVAPTIIQKKEGRKLKEFKNINKAINYAEKKGEYIDLKDDEKAQKFAENGYKQATQYQKGITSLGYKDNSPYKNNSSNLIESDTITMKGVSKNLKGYGLDKNNKPTGEVKDMKANNKSLYKYKSDKVLEIPEGSAIVTAKKGKNKEALNAYKKKDFKKLEKVINQMPEDKPVKKKAQDGLFGTSTWGNNSKIIPTARIDEDEETTSLIKSIDSKAKIDKTDNTEIVPYTEPVSSKKDNKTLSKLGSTASSLVGLAPTIYNLGQGLFGKTEKTNRRLYKPEEMKYKDQSEGLRRDARDAYKLAKQNVREATPNASSYLANAQQAANQRYKNVSDINRQELARKEQIDNVNRDTRNQAQMSNIGLQNQYDDIDLRHKAKKSEYLGKGLEGLSQAEQYRQLNKNRKISDDKRLDLMQTSNFKYDPETGEKIPIKSNGSKNLKFKKKK